MAAIRVFLFLVFVAIITALFVKYVILFLYKLYFKEDKFFKKIVKKQMKGTRAGKRK